MDLVAFQLIKITSDRMNMIVYFKQHNLVGLEL